MTETILAAIMLYLGMVAYHAWLKPLPRHLSLAGKAHRINGKDIEFLYDLTGWQDGQQVFQQRIFDRLVAMLRDAHDFVLIDFFLFNDFLGNGLTAHRPLCQILTRELLELKQRRPNIHILVISDPVNTAYSPVLPAHFTALAASGIPVVFTSLDALRDSNPLYSGFWRLLVRWWGPSTHRYLPHPFSRTAPGLGVRSWLALLNFKANHRKLIITDAPGPGGRRMSAMILSGNPHDASSAHGNVALWVRGDVWRDLINSEQAALNLSGAAVDLSAWLPAGVSQPTDAPDSPDGQTATVQVLTEGKILKALLRVIGTAKPGDRIVVAMFYLSARRIIQALLRAAQRGSTIQVLLDPNREAFGYPKQGLPNRPVAAELVRNGAGNLTVRWANTRHEQFHTKMVLVQQGDQATLIVGSANLTRRNLGDFNLETDLLVTGPRALPALQAAEDYFERLWTNQTLMCSRPYATEVESPAWAYWLYRFQEGSGLATF